MLVTPLVMLTLDSICKWGRRASDLGATAPVVPARDLVLEAAIAHEQLDLLYQPLIDVATGEVKGAEALARSTISDDTEALFARAASAGLAERLSRLVQRKALRCAAVWEGPLRHLRMSINLLPADICRAGYDRWLLEEIESAGIRADRITLEITETALVADEAAASACLEALRSAGFRIALDDFGTGYASLSYLTALPLDMLKLDRGLVRRIAEAERDAIVVRRVIAMARELGLQVVVEGVEDPSQLALLAQWGCDLYQGFLGARPMTADQLMSFVATVNAPAA